MKSLILILPLAFLISCNSNKTSNLKKVSQADENIVEKNNIENIVSSNHKNLMNIKGDLASFKLFIKGLDSSKISTLPLALDYIKTCIPADLPGRDSVFMEYYFEFYNVANALSDRFESGFPQLISELNENKSTPETDAFKDNLKQAGLDLCMTEGIYYFDVIYDFFYSSFKDRVSPGLAEYLNIRKDELKEGFSEDAGMIISFDELYNRIKRWDNYIRSYPNSITIVDAKNYYQTYLETLLTGMDNSRIFDMENNTLNPEIKALYEKAIKEDSTSDSGSTISAYYKFLAKHNFAYNDSISVFLESRGLSTMIAVQPPTR
jgi:hypothetical protein